MMNSPRVAVVAAARTPFTKAGTVQKRVFAHELGRVALREAIERSGMPPGDIQEVIFGNIAQPPEATNIARVVALRAGCPLSVPAYTVNRNCGSALQAVADGVLRIRAGAADMLAVGGTESMSRIPLMFPESMKSKMESVMRARTPGARLASFAAFRPADFKPIVGLLVGLGDNVCGLNMGETAEVLAREFHISREGQDEFALASHALLNGLYIAAPHRRQLTLQHLELALIQVHQFSQQMLQISNAIRKARCTFVRAVPGLCQCFGHLFDHAPLSQQVDRRRPIRFVARARGIGQISLGHSIINLVHQGEPRRGRRALRAREGLRRLEPISRTRCKNLRGASRSNCDSRCRQLDSGNRVPPTGRCSIVWPSCGHGNGQTATGART